MKKYIFLVLILMSFASAHTDDVLAHGEEIVTQNTPCQELSENELEAVGDYLMELMHPGEAHERMDEMHGGEGSESLKDMHLSIAQSRYCSGQQATQGQCGTDECPHEAEQTNTINTDLLITGILLAGAAIIACMWVKR